MSLARRESSCFACDSVSSATGMVAVLGREAMRMLRRRVGKGAQTLRHQHMKQRERAVPTIFCEAAWWARRDRIAMRVESALPARLCPPYGAHAPTHGVHAPYPAAARMSRSAAA